MESLLRSAAFIATLCAFPGLQWGMPGGAAVEPVAASAEKSTPKEANVPASLLLEEAVYELEVNGDRRTARQLLESIHAQPSEALPPVWAEATFRLAVLLFREGESSEARRLAQTLRDQRDVPPQWAARAVDLLSRSSRLPATTRPWPDDEYLLYHIRSPGGEVFGYYSTWSANDFLGDRPVFRQRSWLYIDISQVTLGHEIISERIEDGFRPLRMTGRTPLADVYASTFDPVTRVWTMDENGSERSLNLASGNFYIDNEQTMYLLRVLDPVETPLLTVFLLLPGGFIGEGTYRFVGMEALEDRDPQKLLERWEFELKDAQLAAFNSTSWVDSEGPRHVVRTRSNVMVIDLARVQMRPQTEAYEQELSDFGWAFSVPEGWGGMNFGRLDPYANQVQVTSGDGRAACIWLINPPDGNRTLSDTVDADMRRLRSFLQDFSVIEGSNEETVFHGLPARRVESRFVDRGVPVRGMRYYWKDGERVHWVVIRIQEAVWETHKPAAMAFLESIRPLNATEGKEGEP